MNLITFIVVWTMSWWLVFFLLLPVGVKMEDNPIPGQASSAPKQAFLLRKILATTVISLALTFGFFYAGSQGWFAGLKLRDYTI